MFRRLRADIEAAKRNDPAARNKFEIWLTYSGVHALSWHRFANRLYKMHLKLLARMERGERLSADEYALLAQRGIVRMEQGEPKLLIVRIKDAAANARLLSLGTELKKECENVWAGAKEEYVQAVLADTPKHLRRARAFMLQYLFGADGWFLIYVLKDLMESGRLRQPAEEQKKSLMTVIAPVGE